MTLRRVNANHAKNYPPDGETKVWCKRPKKAFGTTSSDFVNASLSQLQAAANLPSGGISEVGMNAALALIEGVAPKNEIEGALAIQTFSTQSASNGHPDSHNESGRHLVRLHLLAPKRRHPGTSAILPLSG